jgi:hypothetical protein
MDQALPDSAETQRLLEQARSGSRHAFDQLLARHRPYLRQLVELRLDPRLRCRVDPSDIVRIPKWMPIAACRTTSSASRCPSTCFSVVFFPPHFF